MKRAGLILIILIRTISYPALAERPASISESAQPFILNERALDSITAGAVSSVADANAAAGGPSIAETKTDATTVASARISGPSLDGANVSPTNGVAIPSSSGGNNFFVAQDSGLAALDELQEELADGPGFQKSGWAPIQPGPDSLNNTLAGSGRSGIASGQNTSGAGRSLAPDSSGLNPSNYDSSEWVGGHRITRGAGSSVARSDDVAVTGASSSSVAGSMTVRILGSAIASGEDANANTSVFTQAIDTGRVRILIGLVESVACCGPQTGTSARAESFTLNDPDFSHMELRQFNTPQLSSSIGHAVIVTLTPP